MSWFLRWALFGRPPDPIGRTPRIRSSWQSPDGLSEEQIQTLLDNPDVIIVAGDIVDAAINYPIQTSPPDQTAVRAAYGDFADAIEALLNPPSPEEDDLEG